MALLTMRGERKDGKKKRRTRSSIVSSVPTASFHAQAFRVPDDADENRSEGRISRDGMNSTSTLPKFREGQDQSDQRLGVIKQQFPASEWHEGLQITGGYHEPTITPRRAFHPIPPRPACRWKR